MARGVIDDHEFGAQHTEIKLEIVEKYLQSYAIALRNQFSDLWYIDAFAGTGRRTVRTEARDGDLFEEPVPERIESRRGSARIALDIVPKFDRLLFIGESAKHCRALEELKKEYSDREIHVIKGDANQIIQANLKRVNWTKTRAILFLDPYGMEVAWETLAAIAKTEAIDVWFLFPLSGLYRNAARNMSAVDDTKRAALTRMLGTNAWERELYSPMPLYQDDLLGALDAPETLQRNADVKGLEQYVKRRLLDIFPLVMEPFPLPTLKKPQRFSLFFAAANRSEKAKKLATTFADHILKAGISSHVRPR